MTALLLCLMDISMTEHRKPLITTPRWVIGQQWRVEYLRSVPSTEMRSVTQLPPPQRAVWEYKVIKFDSRPGGVAVVSVKEQDGEGSFEVVFSVPDLTLLSVIDTAGGRHLRVATNPAHDTYLSASTGYPVIFDWPRFPEAQRNQSRMFKTPEGNHAEEKVEFLKPDQFALLLTYRQQASQGVAHITISRQSWTVGSPWWSTASAQSEYEVDGEKSLSWSIQGKLLR